MTIQEFENKYWYMSELKAFAKSLKIPVDSKIRKDQLEEMTIQFLETGTQARRFFFILFSEDRPNLVVDNLFRLILWKKDLISYLVTV